MTTYTKATDFLAKDSLPLNNAAKYVKGSEIDTEFDAIETADADNMKKSAMGTGVETFLGTPSSANLAAAVTGETGTGALVFATSPTLVTPALGTPASGTLTNCTGLPQAAVVGLTTADSPQFAGVNVGAASDTTITRASAGVIAVEGNNVVTADKCSIASGKVLTVSNTITLTGTDSTSYNLNDLNSITQLTDESTASGTEAEWTSIPSGVKRIVLSFDGVYTSGGAQLEMLIGDSGGYEVTDYYSTYATTTNGAYPVVAVNPSNIKFLLTPSGTFNDSWIGNVTLTKMQGDNGWTVSGTLTDLQTGIVTIAGVKALSAALDRLKVFITSGTFAGGSISLAYFT